MRKTVDKVIIPAKSTIALNSMTENVNNPHGRLSERSFGKGPRLRIFDAFIEDVRIGVCRTVKDGLLLSTCLLLTMLLVLEILTLEAS